MPCNKVVNLYVAEHFSLCVWTGATIADGCPCCIMFPFTPSELTWHLFDSPDKHRCVVQSEVWCLCSCCAGVIAYSQFAYDPTMYLNPYVENALSKSSTLWIWSHYSLSVHLVSKVLWQNDCKQKHWMKVDISWLTDAETKHGYRYT